MLNATPRYGDSDLTDLEDDAGQLADSGDLRAVSTETVGRGAVVERALRSLAADGARCGMIRRLELLEYGGLGREPLWQLARVVEQSRIEAIHLVCMRSSFRTGFLPHAVV